MRWNDIIFMCFLSFSLCFFIIKVWMKLIFLLRLFYLLIYGFLVFIVIVNIFICLVVYLKKLFWDYVDSFFFFVVLWEVFLILILVSILFMYFFSCFFIGLVGIGGVIFFGFNFVFGRFFLKCDVKKWYS